MTWSECCISYDCYFENALVREGPVHVSLPEPPRSCRHPVILQNARVRRVREGWASTAGRRRPVSLGETYGASSSAASGFSVSLGFSKQSWRGVGAGSLETDPLPAPTPTKTAASTEVRPRKNHITWTYARGSGEPRMRRASVLTT